MSTEQQATTQAEVEVETVAQQSILERAISATAQTPADTTKELLSIMTSQVMEGTVTWNKNLTLTIEQAVAEIDRKISEQLSAVMKNPSFQKLEGSWLGLHKMVKNSELGSDLKIKVVDYTQEELLEQFEDATAIDRSRFFNMVYQEEFGTAGGLPYGVLLGDYEFGYADEDVALLRYMAEVGSASHTPFIAAASSNMFDFDSFTTFTDGKPVASGFDSPAYASWNAFRASDDSRYVALTLPKTMARLPYGQESTKVSSFAFEELPVRENGQQIVSSEDDFVWSNAAYEFGLLLTNAYSKYGWCTAIRGAENGGKIENLPNFTYFTDAGDRVQQCPTQVNLTDEREKELSDLGFLPLLHYKNTNYAVSMGAQSTHKPKTYADDDSNANAAISARLPYTMASSRIAQYLKVMGRDQVGSNLGADAIESHLNNWLQQYVNANAVGNESKAKFPLIEAQVTVEEHAGRPGAFSAIAHLRPWLQMEELTSSIRMVANIPGS
ncbi:type VI secretion system contractile sheath large subunit [Shewanella psychropiezotolerans]|uniref:Type VI secretion system contractile sheath large subunit n=1 Tax=Shewanella psychropiezotolerans TaxID=2593655 RepID=A0ABX5X044_9GAMM|nr:MULTISPECIES: type VI secretion system contractile sheath large subunit [Shewanella]MPY26921.1 type VI secretion system contractile sheath large subunit [Shewanella sp. YLB-07]QDO83353.1 type VI secretion system contractile sheath large subunit [Shewanella psychropiezotolerans]